MGHHGRDDEGAGRVTPPHQLEDRGEDDMSSWCGGLGVPPCGGGPRGDGNVEHVGVIKMETGYH